MIKKNFILVSICCLLIYNSFEADANNFKKRNNLENRDFDYFIFRQIWPQTTCMFPGEHSCSIANNITTWVIHGLWPSIKGEMGPTFCDKTKPFDFNKIKWLEPELLEFWPNLYTNTPLSSFWKHEWEKHGTCALKVPEIKSESDYFNVTLGLRNYFDFGPILKGSSIVPDDTLLYDLDKLKNAIKSVLNVEPLIVCYLLKDSDVQYLSQMQICVSKSFDVVDCSEETLEIANITINNEPQQTYCQPGVPIHYPTIKYKEFILSQRFH